MSYILILVNSYKTIVLIRLFKKHYEKSELKVLAKNLSKQKKEFGLT